MEIPICHICKDPIWSFICHDCLASDIEKWLPDEIGFDFFRFHYGFSEHFRVKKLEPFHLPCIHCREKKEASVCPFCYIIEVSHWLESRDSKLAEELLKMIPRDFNLKRTPISEIAWKDDIEPVTEFRTRDSISHTCENCGEYHDYLSKENGEWVCNICKE